MSSVENPTGNQADLVLVPAREGRAARMRAGDTIKVINTHGKQVVDTWAFNSQDLSEFMSMEHCRGSYMKLFPEVGDALVTNRRRPILTLVEDTTPGRHDTVIAACDRYRYEELGVQGYHANCTDNLVKALADLGETTQRIPGPLNLFMNIPATAEGKLSFEVPLSEAGQYVTLRAEMDLIVAFSACPQDLVPVNDGKPEDVHYQIISK
jgi:uncharacterized protein YcgI (DUF1989 family)